MQDIKLGFINGLDEELIDIYSQLENGKPKFDHVEMGNLRFFFERANKAQIKLIKECIDEKIDYENFSPFLLDTIPIEKMRIYKSIYLEDINKEYINETINVNELSYEELKDVKYLINCAKELFPKENFPNMKLDYIIKQREDQEVNPSNITINLLNYTYNLRLYEKKCIDIVERCLSYKMPPEQLAYLTNPEFSLTYEEMKDVAIGLLNGLTPNEIEAVSGSELKGRALAEAIDNATRDKFFNLDDIEREIEVKTDWFDEIEKEM